MTKTAWVFPGQGSQSQGMGIDLLDVPSAKDKFAQAEDILGWSVVEICQNAEKLSHTLYTQPCLYVVESILADILQQKEQPNLVAGHSLGEYVALYVAGVFEWVSWVAPGETSCRTYGQRRSWRYDGGFNEF
jgi:[acyl-carrier-protein] S-malonyltransferase